MEKLIIAILTLGVAAAIILGAYWLIWTVWCWAVPQLWIGGPANIVAPDFGVFVAALFLLSVIGRSLFGRAGKSKD